MSSIILGIIFLVVCCIGIALWYAWPYLLIAIGVGVVVGLTVHCITIRRYETGIIETEIIRVEPITKREAQNTGYSVGYGYYEHYEYVDVKVGDKVTFRAKWKDGRETTITCKKGDSTYRILYKKLRSYPGHKMSPKKELSPQMQSLANSLKAFENKRSAEEKQMSEISPEMMKVLSAKTEKERIELYTKFLNESKTDE